MVRQPSESLEPAVDGTLVWIIDDTFLPHPLSLDPWSELEHARAWVQRGEARISGVYAALLAPDGIEAVTRAMEGQQAELKASLTLAERYIQEHPELADAIRERGVVAVVNETQVVAAKTT